LKIPNDMFFSKETLDWELIMCFWIFGMTLDWEYLISIMFYIAYIPSFLKLRSPKLMSWQQQTFREVLRDFSFFFFYMLHTLENTVYCRKITSIFWLCTAHFDYPDYVNLNALFYLYCFFRTYFQNGEPGVSTLVATVSGDGQILVIVVSGAPTQHRHFLIISHILVLILTP
jgi:hypothetical protein